MKPKPVALRVGGSRRCMSRFGPKITYKTRAAAEKACDPAKHVYRCPDCGKFHLATNKGKR
jgi:hypothetical protein